MRILVLTAGFGDGHNTAAVNVARALGEVLDGNLECQVCDPISQANPIISGLLQRGYQIAITSLPLVWRLLYTQSARVDLAHPPVELFNGILDWLEAEMLRSRPEAIVSTYPLYASLVRRIDPHIPVYTIITDSITVHRSWATTPSTLHFVADEQSRSVAESLGLATESICVSGFPVAPDFARLKPNTRSQLKRLLWICSTSTRHTLATLRSLLENLPGNVSITMVLGRQESRLAVPVERELSIRSLGRDVTVLGWCTDIPHRMATHDFVLTKAGGATTHECFAAAIPMGINCIVPGQEEGNAELALGRHCAIRIDKAVDTGPMIRELIESGRYSKLAHNIAAVGIPDGAFRVAREIIARRSHSASRESLSTSPSNMSLANTHIDTFLFDIGNVLVTFDFSKVVRFIAADSPADDATIQQAVAQGIGSLETGIIDGITFLSQLAGTVGFSGDLEQLRLVYQDIFEPNEPMHRCVEALCGSYRLVLFSNTSDLHKDWLFAHYPVFSKFDDGVFSFVSGSMKPDDGMYLDAVSKYGIDPKRTIYFDDAPANIAAGIRHGFHSIRYLPIEHDRALEQLSHLAPEIHLR